MESEKLQSYWLPFTSNREFHKKPRIFVGAEGRYFIDSEGRKIFDGLSGLWTCGAGHNRKEIEEAVSRQLQTLDYSPAFQFSHPKAFELSHRIAELAPGDLNHVFFTCTGSDAVDSSLKIARAYWNFQGKASKTKFIGRLKGYHGVNFGGIGVGGIGPNRTIFGPGVEAYHLPHTQISENKFSLGQPKEGKEQAEELQTLIALHGADNIAAVIVEPVSGSGGVIVPPVGYLQRLREICTQNNILLIFDEVITAFGRMGSNFASQEFGVTPDMMTVAKQLTNGSIPMGGVICSSKIYKAFMDLDAPEHRVELPHGYTYSGHPVACAAALASLDILEKEHLVERVREMSPLFEKALHTLKTAKHVSDIRNYGLAGALTLSPINNDPTYLPSKVALSCLEKGFYVRYGGDTLQLGLPFTVETQEIENFIEAIGSSLQEV